MRITRGCKTNEVGAISQYAKKCIFSAMVLSFAFPILQASPASGQEAPSAAVQPDPLDLSRYETMIEEEGFPTVTDVNELEKQANDAFRSGDCEAAIPIIIDYYENANRLGNAIKQGLEPFYGAGYKEREETSLGADLQQLAAAEGEFNKLVRKRNAAWVMEAECLIKSGKRDQGIVRLFRALEFISIDPEDRELWQRTRALLWEQVGYIPN